MKSSDDEFCNTLPPPPPPLQTHPSLATAAFAGACAGLVCDITLYPIDTLRARLNIIQSAPSAASVLAVAPNSGVHEGPVRAMRTEFRRVLASQGVRGLYRGIGAVLLFTPCTNAVYFASYTGLAASLDNQNMSLASSPPPSRCDAAAFATSSINPGSTTAAASDDTAAATIITTQDNNFTTVLERGRKDLLAGFGAELCSCALWTPYEVVKQRMQTERAPASVHQCLRLVLREGGGPRALFVGMGAGVGVYGPYSALFFASFEALRTSLALLLSPLPISTMEPSLPLGGDLVPGLCAGAIAAAVTQPLDCLKTRLQTQNFTNNAPHMTASSSLSTSLTWTSLARAAFEPEGGGWRGLFRGTAARVAVLAPGSGIGITVFEAVRRALA